MLLGAAAHFVGLHPIVGAFAGGVVAGESGMTHRIRDEMKPLNFLLVPIFFVYIGSEVNIQTLASLDVFLYGMLVSLLAFVGKYVECFELFTIFVLEYLRAIASIETDSDDNVSEITEDDC